MKLIGSLRGLAGRIPAVWLWPFVAVDRAWRLLGMACVTIASLLFMACFYLTMKLLIAAGYIAGTARIMFMSGFDDARNGDKHLVAVKDCALSAIARLSRKSA